MADENRSAMTLLQQVQVAMDEWPRPRALESVVAVPTHCMFGSGKVIRVYVAGGGARVVVHDGGAAIDELSSSGGRMPNAVKLLRGFLRPWGFSVTDRGEITSPLVPVADLAPTVALVANAAKEASDFLLDRWKPVIRRDFKQALRTLLEAEFPQLKQEVRLSGQSTKQHRFDFSIPTKEGGELLIDAVAHEQSAISASVLKNIDVRNIAGKRVIQRVIYDDAQEWRAEDLNLLKLGATPVPFSRAQGVIERIAA